MLTFRQEIFQLLNVVPPREPTTGAPDCRPAGGDGAARERAPAQAKTRREPATGPVTEDPRAARVRWHEKYPSDGRVCAPKPLPI